MAPFVLEPSHADFSLINSLACARASLLAYSDEATATATAKDWGFDCVKSLTRGPNHAIVLCNREHILVAFRGTDGLSGARAPGSRTSISSTSDLHWVPGSSIAAS